MGLMRLLLLVLTPDVEALRPKAAKVTDLLAKNDWKSVRADFDPVMEKGLSEDGLANAWASVVKAKGGYVSHGQPTQIPKIGKTAVFDTPMTFERGERDEKPGDAPGEWKDRWTLHPHS